MASGKTTTDQLADSLPKAIASARIVREQVGVMQQSVDKRTLGRNTGLTWNEVSLASVTAQDITEQTVLSNPQQLSDTLFAVTPTKVGIRTFITDRVYARLAKPAIARMGELAQNAVERKKDQDGLTAIDGATTALGTAGQSLTSGHIRAARSRITSNTTEPAPQTDDIIGVFHGFQLKDLEDELLSTSSGALSTQLQQGEAARVFRNGFRGNLGGVQLKEDGNITINASTDDAKGGVFHRQALVLVQGVAPRMVAVRNEKTGGGGSDVYHYDEYAYGERSAGNWLYEIETDALSPTS